MKSDSEKGMSGLANRSPQVVSALSGLPRGRMLGERVNCAGRGSFDRDDLKEAAGAAVRAMESESWFWRFEAGYAGCSALEKTGGAGLDASETAERVALG